MIVVCAGVSRDYIRQVRWSLPACPTTKNRPSSPSSTSTCSHVLAFLPVEKKKTDERQILCLPPGRLWVTRPLDLALRRSKRPCDRHPAQHQLGRPPRTRIPPRGDVQGHACRPQAPCAQDEPVLRSGPSILLIPIDGSSNSSLFCSRPPIPTPATP